MVLESIRYGHHYYRYLSPMVYGDVFELMMSATSRGYGESISHRIGSEVDVGSDMVSMISRCCDLDIPEIVDHIQTADRTLSEGGLHYVFCRTYPLYLIRYCDRVHVMFEVYLLSRLESFHA